MTATPGPSCVVSAAVLRRGTVALPLPVATAGRRRGHFRFNFVTILMLTRRHCVDDTSYLPCRRGCSATQGTLISQETLIPQGILIPQETFIFFRTRFFLVVLRKALNLLPNPIPPCGHCPKDRGDRPQPVRVALVPTKRLAALTESHSAVPFSGGTSEKTVALMENYHWCCRGHLQTSARRVVGVGRRRRRGFCESSQNAAGKREETRGKREEGGGKREEGRRRREEGGGKREEGRRRRKERRGRRNRPKPRI